MILRRKFIILYKASKSHETIPVMSYNEIEPDILFDTAVKKKKLFQFSTGLRYDRCGQKV